MAETRNQDDVQRIREKKDGERHYVMHPENDDLFVRTGKQVIAACRLGISVELWIRELHGAMDEVKCWSSGHAGQIRACYCSPRGGKIVFFFLPSSDRFDFDLADLMVELNALLLKNFNVGMVEVHQVPWHEADRFLDPEMSRHVYGEALATPSTVEA